MNLDQILDQFRTQARNTVVQGNTFEQLAKKYFEHDTQQQQTLGKVWHWEDWAPAHGRSGQDVGIDLVAELRDGGFCAIQAKFYAPEHQLAKQETSSFFAVATASYFQRRILIDTTLGDVSSWVQDRLNEAPPGQRVDLQTLRNSSLDWATIFDDAPEARAKKQPRTHQREALEAVKQGFATHDRGQMIMACGTGKTYAGLLIAEALVGPGGSALVLVPSLALMAQTITEWSNDATTPLRAYSVCSDAQVGQYGKRAVRRNARDEIQVMPSDLVIPATTDARDLAAHANEPALAQLTVVFATYHSLAVIEAAQTLHGLPAFDLILCDEAHRTTGQIKDDKDASNFVIVHDQARIRGQRRLYMTATPRIYSDGAQKKAAEKGAVELASMADESRYGPLFFHRGFAWAIEHDLLTDYRVVVLALAEEEVSAKVQRLLADANNELTLDDATRMVGCYKALLKQSRDDADFSDDPQPCQSALAFCNTINRSHNVQKNFSSVIQEYRTSLRSSTAAQHIDCHIAHVDGKTPGKQRSERLAWLGSSPAGDDECRVLTNVRCLSEGIDVPALDAIMFFDARQSQIDVVQAVGRVMRKAPGKRFGYVVLPIAIPVGLTPEEALNDNKRYAMVWKTLNALRSHDENIEGLIAAMQLGEPAGARLKIIYEGLSSAATIDQLHDTTTVTPGQAGNEQSYAGDEQVDPRPDANALGLSFERALKDAISAKVVEKCGVLNTWTDWATDIAAVARHHITRLTTIVQEPAKRPVFEQFLHELQDDLNDSITEVDAVEMLAQHMITKPVFDAIFQGDQFTARNSVSQAMQTVVETLHVDHLEKERQTLEGFYRSIQNRAAQVRTGHGKQELIRTLYEKFFQGAFGKLTERLGIVFTPVEVVDFILHSVDAVLHDHFGAQLGDAGVHVLDPFTGTGTFLTRLLDADTQLISDAQLQTKYQDDLHANEIVPLAYYIAGINIEAVYHGRRPQQAYQPFEGLCLADTFQSTEASGGVLDELLPKNHARLAKQLELDIEVIVGNPPYSAGQKSGDDNAQNVRYEQSDERLRDTYVRQVAGTSFAKSLFDTYMRAFRWASDRIQGRGVIGFVSNAGWLASMAGSGVRACFSAEFSQIYVLNLRGNQRTAGELSRREGGKIFGSGSRAPIALTLLVQDPRHAGPATLHYHDIGDYLTRADKLAKLNELRSIRNVDWQQLQPDTYGDWLKHRDTRFTEFIPIGEKRKSTHTQGIFEMYSFGIISTRDVWVYSFNRRQLEAQVSQSMAYFNEEIERKNAELPLIDLKNWIRYDATRIHWSTGFLNGLERNQRKELHLNSIRCSMYRPFQKLHGYIDRNFCHSTCRIPLVFPAPTTQNRVICLEDKGSKKAFSCLMVDAVPDLHLFGASQCFPLYYYPKAEHGASSRALLASADQQPHHAATAPGAKYAISANGLRYFRHHFRAESLTQEDLFYYIYGLLHSPQYRAAYQANLAKELVRIPVVATADDFWLFAWTGKELGDLHVNYEHAPLPRDVRVNAQPATTAMIDAIDPNLCKVTKMRYAKKGGKQHDRSTIVFNQAITVTNIPASASEYVVNGKAALDWVVDQYQIKVDPKTGIKNDPNDYARETAQDPAYILKLLLRVITVSLRTNALVAELPELNIAADFVPHKAFFNLA